MLLKIENSLVICSNDKLKSFVSYPDHMTILAKPDMDVGLQTAT